MRIRSRRRANVLLLLTFSIHENGLWHISFSIWAWNDRSDVPNSNHSPGSSLHLIFCLSPTQVVWVGSLGVVGFICRAVVRLTGGGHLRRRISASKSQLWLLCCGLLSRLLSSPPPNAEQQTQHRWPTGFRYQIEPHAHAAAAPKRSTALRMSESLSVSLPIKCHLLVLLLSNKVVFPFTTSSSRRWKAPALIKTAAHEMWQRQDETARREKTSSPRQGRHQSHFYYHTPPNSHHRQYSYLLLINSYSKGF